MSFFKKLGIRNGLEITINSLAVRFWVNMPAKIQGVIRNSLGKILTKADFYRQLKEIDYQLEE